MKELKRTHARFLSNVTVHLKAFFGNCARNVAVSRRENKGRRRSIAHWSERAREREEQVELGKRQLRGERRLKTRCSDSHLGYFALSMIMAFSPALLAILSLHLLFFRRENSD